MHEFGQNLVFWDAHFKIVWHLLILCKSMFTPDLSDWMAYRAPLIPWFWAFSWLCASNVCTLFDVHMHFMPKSILFVHTSITEDNLLYLIICHDNSLHFRVKFMFLIKFIRFITIGDDWVISNARYLLTVITQGFSFICCRTVEACTPY